MLVAIRGFGLKLLGVKDANIQLMTNCLTVVPLFQFR